MQKIKIGILGCAEIAQRLMIPAIIKHPAFELVSIASRSPRKAKRIINSNNCKAKADNYNSIVSNPEIDALYIPLPNGVRYEWIIKALSSGKHVLSEKSIAMSFSAAQSMVRLARKKKKILLENFMFLNHLQHNYVSRVIENKEIGKILSIISNFSIPNPKSSDIRMNPKLGSGALFDLGCYNIRLPFFLFKEDFHPIFYNRIKKKNIDQFGYLAMKSKNNIYSISQFGFGSSYQNYYKVIGNKGSLYVKRAFSMPNNEKPEITIKMNQKTKKVRLSSDDQFYNTLSKFYNDIKNKNIDKNCIEILSQAKIIEKIRKYKYV